MTTINLGSVTVVIGDGYTTTEFADGSRLVAEHAPQDGQEATAASLGMSVEEMNRTHDMVHSWLAHVMGLPHSPTLYGVATGKYCPLHHVEESAVLAVQRWAVSQGIDLVEMAKGEERHGAVRAFASACGVG